MKKTTTPTLSNMGLLPWVTIQCTLPHSRPRNPDGSDAARYERVNGGVRLVMFADPTIGLPYGKVPRVLMAHAVGQFKRNRAHQSFDEARTIDLGPSWRALAHRLGMTSAGGPRGPHTALQRQAQRLFLSVIRREIVRPEPAHQYRYQLMTSEGHLPGGRRRGTVEPRWSEDGVAPLHPTFKNYVRLSRDFAKACEIAVPVNMDTMAALQAPFAIDLYAWLSYRSGKLVRSNEPYVHIPWHRLMEQFGHGYTRARDFRRAFRRQLLNVLEHYPARVDHQRWPNGIVLYPQDPHIAPLPEEPDPADPPPQMRSTRAFRARVEPDLESEPARDAGSDPTGPSVPHADARRVEPEPARDAEADRPPSVPHADARRVDPPRGVQDSNPEPPAPGGGAPTPPPRVARRSDPTSEGVEGPRSDRGRDPDLDRPPDRPPTPRGVSNADPPIDPLGGPPPRRGCGSESAGRPPGG